MKNVRVNSLNECLALSSLFVFLCFNVGCSSVEPEISSTEQSGGIVVFGDPGGSATDTPGGSQAGTGGDNERNEVASTLDGGIEVESDSLDTIEGPTDAGIIEETDQDSKTELDSGGLACAPDEGYCAFTDECCEDSEVCFSFGCVTPGPACEDSGSCSDDSYCDGDEGVCIPWGEGVKGVNEPNCSKTPVPGVFFPQMQCEWTGPPEGDAFPDHQSVLGSVIAASFIPTANGAGGGANDGSIQQVQLAFISYAGTDGGLPSASCCGVIRVIDGKTCKQLFTLGDHYVVGGGNLAAGDLDGDGIPEIVAQAEGGGLVAFSLSLETQAFELKWHSTLPDGTQDTFPGASVYQWNGPSIADVTGDDKPEIIVDGALYSAEGVQLTQSLGWSNYQQGMFPVIGDADLDGEQEIFFGTSAYRVNEVDSSFEVAPFQQDASAAGILGHVALADFGAFPGAAGTLPALAAEIAVVSDGNVSLYDLTGQQLWGPVPLPGGGTGGPPTVADFDGDGSPEIAAAGALAYTVFDLECEGDPLPEKCSEPNVLWSQASQDQSSNKTGSSVFDFEGDGQAEAVYGDECFLRVYNGLDGDVLFSGPRSSCTWHEMPIIADVDGDYRTEIVIGSNLNCSVGCPEIDPIFAGLRCDSDEQCASKLCLDGLCRCESDTECSEGTLCSPMLVDDGLGQVCRAAHTGKKKGVQVFSDAKDTWVSSRRIWNQHAYNVTNVNEDGTIPPRSEVKANWSLEGMNHFRQNAQGTANPVLAADLTIEFINPVQCDNDQLSWLLEVCNRGALPVGAGVQMEVNASGTVAESFTQEDLFPGTCIQWIGTMPVPSNWEGSLYASVDRNSGGEIFECIEGNNGTSSQFPLCGP